MDQAEITGVAEVVGPRPLSASAAEAILRRLPQWFGIESSLLEYAAEAEVLPNFVAIADDSTVGFVTVRAHNAVSLELVCIGIVPELHGCGIGTRLCNAAEAWWRESGGGLLQVKTLGPSRPNVHYARTRRFYDALGFLPVEEFADLWPGNPCLLLVKPLVRREEQSS